jgi:hypothetical protein
MRHQPVRLPQVGLALPSCRVKHTSLSSLRRPDLPSFQLPLHISLWSTWLAPCLARLLSALQLPAPAMHAA